MGFLDHTTNSIVVDAVLTDTGRELLSRSNGGLQILSYAFADPEVDYSNLEKYGDIIGSEKIIKNTPIYEATTNSKIASFYTDSLLYSSEDGTNSLSISSTSLVTSGIRGSALSIPVTYTIGGSTSASLLWRVYYDSSLLDSVSIGGNTFSSPITWSGDIKYVEVETGNAGSENATVQIGISWKSGLDPSLTTMSAITIQEDAISGLSIQQTLTLTT